jgi:predicted PhzF superfamily epimerase YddE/YHI9
MNELAETDARATFRSNMISSHRQYFVVDAFTGCLFAGNPAAVVQLQEWRENSWLQNVAMEMNLSETAFLVANANGFDLRWFTPKAEVDLCGHATLASAVVLAELGELADGSRVAFSTRSGVLTAERRGSIFLLDFPALISVPSQPPPGLLESLKVPARYVGQSKFDFVIEVESEKLVRSIAPDFNRLASVKCRGVIVTAKSDDPQFDFVSRFFAPAVGVNEDPVTGSAHCLLAPYWGTRLGKSEMIGYQASSRGGVVQVEIRGERVMLGGEGVVFARGNIAERSCP